MYDIAMSSYTVSEARAHLPELLDRVAEGEEITVTRHGRPAVILIHPERRYSGRAAAILEEADRLGAQRAALAGQPMPAPIPDMDVDARIAQLRADRDAR